MHSSYFIHSEILVRTGIFHVCVQARHMCEIQRLMGCLLFVDRAPDDTPYADLLAPTRWEEVAHEFARQACSLMGQVGARWEEVAHEFGRDARV
jgi:hypothetical protein